MSSTLNHVNKENSKIMIKLLKNQESLDKILKSPNINSSKLKKNPTETQNALNELKVKVKENIKITNSTIKSIVLDYVENEMKEIQKFINYFNDIIGSLSINFGNAFKKIINANENALIGNRKNVN